MSNQGEIKLLILDVDGVLTDGTKTYDKDHKVISKKFKCKDFTAIKRIIASGIRVVMVSGDNFNESMAKKRNIDFYCSRNSDLSLDKSRYVNLFEEKYGISKSNMSFVGDDFFDLSIIKILSYTFCPSDSPRIVKDNCKYTLTSKGGDGVIVELYDFLIEQGFILDASEEIVNELDKKEITSEEMK
jgi:3-deoxy-D-manno-octulosonate 8-phosphate phosphatase (KDO 8-P phosphatase)